MIKNATNATNRISGLIFISDQDITSKSRYMNPKLISIASRTDGLAMKPFSYEQGSKNLSFKMNHRFVENCYVLYGLAPTFFFTSTILFITSAIWISFVYGLRKNSSFPIQKILTIIPVLKGIEVMLYGLDYQKCPWVWEDIAPEAYLKMGKVTSVTFSYTFLHAFLYMLCRGWSLTIHTVDRNQATNVTMVMGLIYLMYSAYFLSIDFSGMMEFVNIVLAFVYLILGIINFQSLTKQIYLVRQLLLNADETIPAAF